jgi:hypothetical protein
MRKLIIQDMSSLIFTTSPDSTHPLVAPTQTARRLDSIVALDQSSARCSTAEFELP